MERLFLLFDAIHPLSPELRTYLLRILVRKDIKKKGIILQAGKTAGYIYFIEKGLVRSVRIEKGKEKTAWVMKEGNIIVSVESFFLQQPATEMIEALEDCILHCISYKELYEAYRLFLEFNLHRGVILEHYYAQSEARNRMQLKPARDKFEELMLTQPELVGRANDKILASYLGITPGTFSLQKSLFAGRKKKEAAEKKVVPKKKTAPKKHIPRKKKA